MKCAICKHALESSINTMVVMGIPNGVRVATMHNACASEFLGVFMYRRLQALLECAGWDQPELLELP